MFVHMLVLFVQFMCLLVVRIGLLRSFVHALPRGTAVVHGNERQVYISWEGSVKQDQETRKRHFVTEKVIDRKCY